MSSMHNVNVVSALCHNCKCVIIFPGRTFVLTRRQMSAFTAAIVLLLYIWSGKRHGMAVDSVKEMVDVSRCINVLKSCESR